MGLINKRVNMKGNLRLIFIGLLFLLLYACATTDNLGDLSKRFEDIKKIEPSEAAAIKALIFMD